MGRKSAAARPRASAARDNTLGLNSFEIGKRIAQSRLELEGMTQRELGDLVGVTERSIAAWELGETIPFRHMNRLETILQKPAAWILYGETAQPVDLGDQLEKIHKELAAIRKLLNGTS